MKFSSIKAKLPSPRSSLLAIFSAILLILAFPDFEFWFLAYVALIPLFFAVEREKASFAKSFLTGWIFGAAFFTGTCWWLTYAPITYGGVPWPLAYFLLLGATSVAGLFPAVFAGLFSLVLKRFGSWGIFAAPFLWTATEYLRFWITGNNWNAIAYSQAFNQGFELRLASIGGIYLTIYSIVLKDCLLFFLLFTIFGSTEKETGILNIRNTALTLFFVSLLILLNFGVFPRLNVKGEVEAQIIAIQPNVPMSGIKYQDWLRLRDRHVQLAESELEKLKANPRSENPNPKSIVVFPESPMNFGFTEDRDFQEFLADFTQKNNVQVLFNAAEPSDRRTYFNSAVMVDEKGDKIAQYDKIYLVPFGEYVPLPEPLAGIMPTMVGNFEIGREYDIVPLGGAKAGIMICFESHFPTLSRQYALRGADVIVEMTNDGYLGPTPILRQHLASAVFRAVETNRPVLRVTNVGITGYINERGEIQDPSQPYTEDSRVWTVARSDGSRTFYVQHGDWFAWLCLLVGTGLLLGGFRSRNVSGVEK